MSNTIYERALEKFGKEAQLEKLEEELIEALFAVRKYRFDKGSWEDVREELVDVEIMITQFKMTSSWKNIWYITKGKKLLKLEKFLSD